MNEADEILSDKTLEETASTFDLCDLKIRPDPLPALKSLNQPTLNLSPSSSRSILISLSKKIYETPCFSKDKGTSNSLGISNPLVSENLENKRIVSRKNIVSKLFYLKKH